MSKMLSQRPAAKWHQAKFIVFNGLLVQIRFGCHVKNERISDDTFIGNIDFTLNTIINQVIKCDKSAKKDDEKWKRERQSTKSWMEKRRWCLLFFFWRGVNAHYRRFRESVCVGVVAFSKSSIYANSDGTELTSVCHVLSCSERVKLAITWCALRCCRQHELRFHAPFAGRFYRHRKEY